MEALLAPESFYTPNYLDLFAMAGDYVEFKVKSFGTRLFPLNDFQESPSPHKTKDSAVL